MLVVRYTRHARDKCKTKEAKLFKIGKKTIEHIVHAGSIVERDGDVIVTVGSLDESHSLCVAYKREGEDITVVTFFAAKKGRYERKILH